MNSVYGIDTITANDAKYWLSRFHRSMEFLVILMSRRPFIESIDKNIRNRRVRQSHSIVSLLLWMPQELTQKNRSISESDGYW